MIIPPLMVAGLAQPSVVTDVKPGGAEVSLRRPAPVKFFASLMELWHLGEEDAARLLGFEETGALHDLLQGRARLCNRDTKDRIRHLFRIRDALHSLFRNVDVEREWLREKRPELDGSSPLELMLEGSMENMLWVKEFVQRLSGR